MCAVHCTIYNRPFYSLGSFENAETELMSGKIYPYQKNRIFWTVFLSIVLSISLLGSLALFIKRYLSFKANLNRVQKIHITLKDQNQNMNDKVGYFHNFNTHSYNLPLLSCFETNILFSLAICIMALYLMNFLSDARRRQIHQNAIYTEIIVEYVLGIVIPLYVLMKKKAIRIYFWNHLQNISR